MRSNCSSFIAAASAVGHGKGIGRRQAIVLDVDGAIGAARQRLAQHLGDAGGPGRADHDFPAVLFLEPQALLERIGVRLVHLVAGVLLADPGAASFEPGCQSRVGTCLMQTAIFISGFESLRAARAALVPPKRNELDMRVSLNRARIGPPKPTSSTAM